MNNSDEQADRIRENLRDVDWDRISLNDFEELFEDRDPFEFL